MTQTTLEIIARNLRLRRHTLGISQEELAERAGHGLSFIDILRYIGSGEKLRVEKHKRSAKTTIMIPISMGQKIGSVTAPAEFDVVHNVTLNGRHDIFARPTGGKIEIDLRLVEQLLQ